METLVADPPPPLAPVAVASPVCVALAPPPAVAFPPVVVALLMTAPPAVALVPAVSVFVTLVVSALLVSLVPVALTTDKVWFCAPTSVPTSVALAAGPAVAFPAVAFAAIGGPLTMSLPFGGTIVPAG